MPLPYQGRPGQRDLASPTLIPNFYPAFVGDGANGATAVNYKSPLQVDQDNPRATASATATIGGTVTVGDTITLTVTQAQLPNGSVSASYTTQTGDTLARIAASLASAMDAALKTAGVLGTIWSTSTNAVFTLNWNGPLGNYATLSDTLSGGATETVTLSPLSGKLSGGSGPVYCANNFNYSFGGVTKSFFYGQPYLLSGAILDAMVSQDMPMV